MPSRLLIHRTAAAVVTILAVAATVSLCHAADPPSITGLAARSSLSADERAQIEQYATAYTGKLLETTDDPGEIRRVRGKLVDVIRRGGTSEIFRDTYSRYALPGLTTVVKDGSPDQSVTALIVVAQLGTEQALSMLLGHCAQDDEPRRHVRLAAARSCGYLLSSAGSGLGANKVTAAARLLADAAVEEPDHYTLRHLIQAIQAATEATGNADERGQMHRDLVRAIEQTAERAALAKDKEAADLLAAMYPVLHRLRTKFIVMDPVMQRSLGRALGPCVRKVLDVATAHWNEFQNADADQPANIIVVCERFLATIDRVVRGDGERPAEENLKDAWDRGDVQRFKEVLGRWTALLSRPPY